MDVDLAVLLFGITLAVEVVGWIGADAISSFFYAPVVRFSSNPALKSQKVLRAEIVKLRAELNATSSVDEFSKWAKLRRKVDKAVSNLETINASSSQSRQAFQARFKRALWALTTVLPFIVTSWHRKAAVFYLPPNWFGPATWWLGLPSAPTGAVACGIWTMACKRTIGTVKDCFLELTHKETVVTKVPVPVIASPVAAASSSTKTKVEKEEKGKKEL